MSRQEIKNQILLLKKLAAVTAPKPEWLKTNREILLMQVKNTITKKEEQKFGLKQVWSFFNIFLPKQIVSYALRPAMSLVAVAGLIFGGWITTVSASYNSLPGDVLYPVKLATESVQTSLSAKPQATKLHVDFAARRVEEVKQIVTSNLSKTQKEQKVEEAVKHLKSDLNQAKNSMEEIKKDSKTQESAATVVDVAKAVDQKTLEIQKNLDQTKIQLSLEVPTASIQVGSVQDQVKQATAVAADTGVKAVEILVQQHQEDKNSVTAEDVKSAVDNKLKNLEEKVGNIDLQINQVTSSTIATPTNTADEKKDKAAMAQLVAPAKETNDAAKVSISQAKDELSKDNLGAAMDKIKEGSVLTQAAQVKADATQILVVPVSVVTSTIEKNDDAIKNIVATTSTVSSSSTPEKK